MHHDVSRNTLLLCRDSPPLAKIFTQFGIDSCNGRLGCGSGRQSVRERQPMLQISARGDVVQRLYLRANPGAQPQVSHASHSCHFGLSPK